MAVDHVAVINFHHLVFIFLWLQSALLIVMCSHFKISKPGCVNKCGNVSIPYPFGMGDENCFFNQYFKITCDETLDITPAVTFVNKFGVFYIDLDGLLEVPSLAASDCYAKNGSSTFHTRLKTIPDLLGPFTFLNSRHKLVAIGCDTVAYIIGANYTTGCISLCGSIDNVINTSCTGIGCCQASIPIGPTSSYTVELRSFNNHSGIWDINPCSYALLAAKFQFSISDLQRTPNMAEVAGSMLVDWALGSSGCDEAEKNSTGTYSCGVNSYCRDSPSGDGYLCKCLTGYEGNPYLINGCQGIDECSDLTSNECLPGACYNEAGGHRCSCPPGHQGDGKIKGIGCTITESQGGSSVWLKVTLGITISILLLLVISSWLYLGFKKRKLMQMKEKFYRQNGGLMFEKIMKEQHDNDLNVKIFTDEELKKATNNYDESQIIGRGGFGTVYKGILTGKTAVAIKRSKIVDQSQTEQFVNEVAVLSQINHRNVVKLLGCCLENEVPLLVYEFVTNGTLFQHLHDEGRVSLLSWETRLRIAAEIATSLSYLHSEASIPIIHRDIKSCNILLDDNYTAKVADFGASRLVPLDQTQLTTLVQGTLGYLDPEYFHTSQLTEKSDVYSFGVLLAELLTGKKALSYERPKEEINLATYFISAMKEDRVFQILEERLVSQARAEHIDQVAKLTKRCLRVKGEKRPTMKEVAIILDGLRMSVNDPCAPDNEPNREENVYLLAEATNSYTGTDVAGYDSLIELVPTSSGR